MSSRNRDDASGDYEAEVDCIKNIKTPLLKLIGEQRQKLLQDISEECICNKKDDICKKLGRYLPSIISFALGLIIIVSGCLYFGDILCNKSDKPLMKPPAF